MEKAVSGNICTQTLKVTAQHSQVPSEKEPRHLVFFRKPVLGIIHAQGAKSRRGCRDLEPTIHEVVF